MKNKNGQALIEFILILPVIIILIFTTIDIFNLVIKKNELENEISDQINLIVSKKNSLDNFKETYSTKYHIEIDKNDKYIEIVVSKKHRWISPVTKLILSDDTIDIKRVIPNEQ